MERKLLKTFLLAVGLLVGANYVWADAEIPVYNSSTGFYELNTVSYVKKTYSFGSYTYANNSSDTAFPAGFTGSNVDRYKNTISSSGLKAHDKRRTARHRSWLAVRLGILKLSIGYVA